MFTAQKLFSSKIPLIGNCNIEFLLNTFSDQITICLFFLFVWNLYILYVKQIIHFLEQKSKYLNSIEVFPCLSPLFRSSRRPEVFCKKSVLQNFAKFAGKYLCRSLFFELQASGSGAVDFLWILQNLLQETSVQLLLIAGKSFKRSY